MIWVYKKQNKKRSERLHPKDILQCANILQMGIVQANHPLVEKNRFIRETPISAELKAGTCLLWNVNKRKLLISDNMIEDILRRVNGRPSTYGSEFWW